MYITQRRSGAEKSTCYELVKEPDTVGAHCSPGVYLYNTRGVLKNRG